MEYKLGEIASAFIYNTDKRISKDLLDPNTLAVYETLQEELFKALRVIENSLMQE